MRERAKDSSTTTITVPTAEAASERALWGFFDCKKRWSLSWRGRLFLVFALLLVGTLIFRGIYPFLAITHRVDAEVLVVEGWVHGYAIKAGVAEFKINHYQQVFSTGGPVQGNGGYVNDFQTSASVGAERLKANGIPSESLQMVPSHVIDRDRTYGAAVALRDWFSAHKIQVRYVNVITEDLHARRTRLLFQKALGDGVKIGIIAVPNPDYDAKHWWHYSEGVKDVISEGAAYLYARLFFWPGAAEPREVEARGQMTEDSSQKSEVKH
ncbi:MAG: ElyC/SanA/YdcF family protein [Candidatus Udaeobacter sp.]